MHKHIFVLWKFLVVAYQHSASFRLETGVELDGKLWSFVSEALIVIPSKEKFRYLCLRDWWCSLCLQEGTGSPGVQEHYASPWEL